MSRAKLLAACLVGILIARGGAAPPATETGAARKLTIREEPGRVVVAWSGPVEKPMRDEIAAAIARFRTDPRRLTLTLNSPGGSIEQGHEVMAVVRDAARLRPIVTHVGSGATCASMCVPIYLLGTERTADPDGQFMFHEASLARAAETEGGRKVSAVPERARRIVETIVTDALYRDDLGGERVDGRWLAGMRARIVGHDVWTSAKQLVDGRSGVVDALTSR